MDNNKPYNEIDQQFNNLPLPDEDQSWQKMKELLDKDENNKRVPPVLLRTCAGWGFLLMLVAAVTWFIVRPEKMLQKKEIAEQSNKTEKQNQDNTAKEKIVLPKENGSQANSESNSTNTNAVTNTEDASTNNGVTIENKSKGFSSTSNNKQSTVTISSHQSVVLSKQSKSAISKTKIKSSIKSATVSTGTDVEVNTGFDKKINQKINDLTPAPEKIKTEVSEIPTTDQTGNSSTGKSILQQSDSVKASLIPVADSITNSEEKQKEKTKKKLIVSAGAGLQQQIPFGGQSTVPYDYYGRKSSLSDYVPSIYLRLEKDKKWFVQTEFRYGAPQSIKDFSYSRQTKLDIANNNLTTTTYRLKKTYYHQLPLSFNYYILPNWSVGGGGIYNRFYGAVTEKEVTNKNLQTQVETSSREIVQIKQFTDSFLYKTQVHVLFQTNYQWKRFGFGLRYTKDVQPFIKYTKPDGVINVEKNQTMQFLVRYRLWQN